MSRGVVRGQCDGIDLTGGWGAGLRRARARRGPSNAGCCSRRARRARAAAGTPSPHLGRGAPGGGGGDGALAAPGRAPGGGAAAAVAGARGGRSAAAAGALASLDPLQCPPLRLRVGWGNGGCRLEIAGIASPPQPPPAQTHPLLAAPLVLAPRPGKLLRRGEGRDCAGKRLIRARVGCVVSASKIGTVSTPREALAP
jgi:hypothetical protein